MSTVTGVQGEERHEYWSALIPGAEPMHVQSPLNLDDNAERLRTADSICIWSATSLSEHP